MEFVLFIIVAQVLTLLHELGHAIGALVTSEKEVLVVLGRTRKDSMKEVFSIGRLKIKLGLFSPVTGFTHIEMSNLSRAQLMAFYFGGPLMSLSLTFILFVVNQQLINSEVHKIIRFASVYALIQFFITALPIRYPDFWGDYGNLESDGLSILKLFRKNSNVDID
ncbi:MAG TPA: hypothetical protein PLI19_01725 [Erysipelotrichaceae bacterium]|nr:hypothetical protein [Erysipelotrichaceae bacterium]HQB32027.1 hypothetical protein [Erysipelotrichaceae bacterium]